MFENAQMYFYRMTTYVISELYYHLYSVKIWNIFCQCKLILPLKTRSIKKRSCFKFKPCSIFGVKLFKITSKMYDLNKGDVPIPGIWLIHNNFVPLSLT